MAALKVRWKSLRDAYVKERNYDIAKTSGVKLKNKKPWRLKSQLEFLAPFIHNRKDIGKTMARGAGVRSGRTETSVPKDTPSESPSKAKDPPKTRSENGEIRKNMFNETVPSASTPRLIEIDSFFRSIADSVKCLSPKSQVSIQREITELVMNYKLRELEEDGTGVKL